MEQVKHCLPEFYFSFSLDSLLLQGSLRCDVNISVNRVGRPPGTRCEIKNLNSVRFMMAAIRELRPLPLVACCVSLIPLC